MAPPLVCVVPGRSVVCEDHRHTLLEAYSVLASLENYDCQTAVIFLFITVVQNCPINSFFQQLTPVDSIIKWLQIEVLFWRVLLEDFVYTKWITTYLMLE